VNRIQDAARIGYWRAAYEVAGGRPAAGAIESVMGGTEPGLGGTRIGIRVARSGDCEAIKSFLAGLSPRSRYLRFFTGAPTASTATLRRLAGDGENVEAIVATEAGAIIGHAMAADTTGPTGARVTEIGVAVTDTRQGRGVGTALTRELAQRARARGVTVLAMDVLAENRRVLAMIAGHWPAAHYDQSGTCVTVYTGLGSGGGGGDRGRNGAVGVAGGDAVSVGGASVGGVGR
jgi:GNAT superfamily N-acetyltransferase